MREKNVLLLGLSKANEHAIASGKRTPYRAETGGELIYGRQQNVGTAKLLCRRLKSDGKRLDKILYIASEATKKVLEIPGNDKNSIDLFKDEIMEAYPDFIGAETFEQIDITDTPSNTEVSRRAVLAATRIEDMESDGSKVNVFIDSNGAQRYLTVVLIAISRLLRHRSINIGSIFSIDYDQKKNEANPNIIQDNMDQYEIMDLVAGIEEYINYGRISTLKRYFLDDEKNGLKEDWEKEVIRCMEQVSDNFQLCRFNGVIGQIKRLNRAIRKYDEKPEKGDSGKSKQLGYVIEDIKKQYNKLLDVGAKGEDPEDIITMISWCIENDYIQQALTFYCERMPQFLIEKKYIYLDGKAADAFKLFSGNLQYEEHYRIFTYFLKRYYEFKKGGLSIYYFAWLREIVDKQVYERNKIFFYTPLKQEIKEQSISCFSKIIKKFNNAIKNGMNQFAAVKITNQDDVLPKALSMELKNYQSNTETRRFNLLEFVEETISTVPSNGKKAIKMTYFGPKCLYVREYVLKQIMEKAGLDHCYELYRDTYVKPMPDWDSDWSAERRLEASTRNRIIGFCDFLNQLICHNGALKEFVDDPENALYPGDSRNWEGFGDMNNGVLCRDLFSFFDRVERRSKAKKTFWSLCFEYPLDADGPDNKIKRDNWFVQVLDKTIYNGEFVNKFLKVYYSDRDYQDQDNIAQWINGVDVKTDLDREDWMDYLTQVLKRYSKLKNQRNLSNHASDGEKESPMTVVEIKREIIEGIKQLKP